MKLRLVRYQHMTQRAWFQQCRSREGEIMRLGRRRRKHASKVPLKIKRNTSYYELIKNCCQSSLALLRSYYIVDKLYKLAT